MMHKFFGGRGGRHTHDDRDGHGRRFARGDAGPGERHGRGHHGAGGRAGLSRFFAHGDLRLLILQLIAEKPRHGYEIIKEIEERVAGAYTPSPGVIYPTLTLLEELGYVIVTPGDGAKKLHTITPEGTAFLGANRPTLDAILARIDDAVRTHGAGPAPQILRAMENLKLALRMRLARGPLDTAQIDAVTVAIDTAATTVERS